jgi:hypothetical protein
MIMSSKYQKQKCRSQRTWSQHPLEGVAGVLEPERHAEEFIELNGVVMAVFGTSFVSSTLLKKVQPAIFGAKSSMFRRGQESGLVTRLMQQKSPRHMDSNSHPSLSPYGAVKTRGCVNGG